VENQKFFIKGLDGQRVLSGKIDVMGAKNAALKVFAASILFDDSIQIDNVPIIEDIARMRELLSRLF